MHRQFCLESEKQGGNDMSEEIQEQQPKQEKKGKTIGKWCVVCKERESDYTRNGSPVCHACIGGRVHLTEQFFPFTFKDQISDIQVKGFHPSPLDI